MEFSINICNNFFLNNFLYSNDDFISIYIFEKKNISNR